MAPQAATPTGPVVPLSTATEAPSAASLLPTFPLPSSTPVSYYPLDADSSSNAFSGAAADSTSRVKPSSLSSSSARTLGAVLGSVIGLALLGIALASFYLCCRKRARAASSQGVYRNSSFHAGPAYHNYPTESAATSKEAFAHYPRGSAADAAASGSLQMSDLELARGNPPRRSSVATYDGTPGVPVTYAKSEGLPHPFHVVARARDVKAVKAGTPVRAVIAPVLTSSPESIRPPMRPQAQRQPEPPQRDPRSPASDSSLASNSPAGSLSSSPETRLSHDTVPTPPTSPLHGGHKTEQGRPKLKIVTSTVGQNQVPQVTIEPLRLPQPAAQGRKPEYARLLFAAGIATPAGSNSSLSAESATATGAVEDVFSPASSPVQPEHAPVRHASVPPPAIVITSPQVEWEGDEQPFSPETQYPPEDDNEYASDEQDEGDFSDREEMGEIDDEASSEEEDLASSSSDDEGTYSPTERATPTRAITLDLHLPLRMSTSHPPLPSGFPSSVTFPASASNASYVSSASPTQGLPMTFASRRELTSPTGFPQSPCESEADFDDPDLGEMDASEGLAELGFSPVLGHPIMHQQHQGKGAASFRVLDLERSSPSPVPLKRPQTAEERLRGLGIGDVRLPTIMVTEWAEEGLMRF
ncbi:hypothetical protein CALVIDRAFT_561888 [Calocera viscosa TUFC12733]|uniref:Uncharacterized protein n=1 Tax=Calocera viscosa (strain TUFC12733) TaxID=1330018 RepID=A0A167PN03_CALVF|nr:hypothetical protein CALVIDRAFT_561888 [Calocera viscosa TUFC12733]